MNKQNEKYIVGGIILVGAYFAIIRPILTKVGIFKSREEKETEKRKEGQLEAQIKEVAKNETPTKSVQEWQIIADQIYNNLRYSAVSDNKADAGYQVARVKNNADFWQLYKLFGKRREYLFGIPSGGLMDLAQFIRSNLSASAIATINDNYRRKKIKFRF